MEVSPMPNVAAAAPDRYVRQCVDAVRTCAGVADQDPTCPNGTVGCPGPNTENSELPCAACFFGGEESVD